MALGEGPAKRDACPLALSPCPQDGMLMPYSRAASSLSFWPIGAQCLMTPLWPNKPIVLLVLGLTVVTLPLFLLLRLIPGPTQHAQTTVVSEVIFSLPIRTIGVSCLALLALLVLGGRTGVPRHPQGQTEHN
ncbi:hypothetical protein E2C01_014702 [Portunus trituberculatus]|uniref:Uncharacterized protein n=1 Tax=Portunus trituberculatus TaxID=210409 RepID=A0A5B7DJX5_PORTR|nr:hypothetical protein [Portunus trituberculatus]